MLLNLSFKNALQCTHCGRSYDQEDGLTSSSECPSDACPSRDTKNLKLSAFSVVSYAEDTGQVMVDKVYANKAFEAIVQAAYLRSNQDVCVIAAIPAATVMEYPGAGLVSAETVREQRDVFGLAKHAKTKGTKDFVVVGLYEDNGQHLVAEVTARDGLNAFAKAAAQYPEATFACVLEGLVASDVTTAGEKLAVYVEDLANFEENGWEPPCILLTTTVLENCLAENAVAVANTGGKSFEAIAQRLISNEVLDVLDIYSDMDFPADPAATLTLTELENLFRPALRSALLKAGILEK